MLILKKLYRSNYNKVIAGVCGGLGEYFNVDPVIFRVLFIAFSLGYGAGILIYILMVLLVPTKL